MEILPYTDAHRAFRRRFREFLKAEVAPDVDGWEKDGIVPRRIWKKMGREGFLCTSTARAYGGREADFLYPVVIIEEMVRTFQNGFFAFVHSDIVVPYIEAFGTPAQKEKYLPSCVSGDRITAVAMTEPDAGSDLSGIRTTATENGDTVVIDGAKIFISNGINCDLIVLAAKNPDVGSAHEAISLYLVEDGSPGLKKGRRLAKMGLHSQDTAELFFSSCRIPAANRLGQKGAGFPMLMEMLQQERIVCTVWAAAIAETVLNWTCDFWRDTGRSRRDPAKVQAGQFALAEMATEVEIGKTFIEQLILAHMKGKKLPAETAMAKHWISTMAKTVADRCLSLVGDFAATEKCPIVRLWRDIRVFSIFAGTNEVMKQIISKNLGL